VTAWLAAASSSARLVSERPDLWLPGALAWSASVGWLPLVVAVARPPTVAELTFLGARIVTSGAWPWNAVAIALGVTGVVVAAFVVVAAANAALIATLDDRTTRRVGARRVLTIDLVAAIPAAVLVAALLAATALVATGIFNAPDDGGAGPVVRLVGRLAPILAALAVAVVVGAAFAAAAARSDGLRNGLPRLMHLGPAALAQALLGTALHVAYLIVGALLLGVLWAPIGAELGVRGEFDLATGLLLVGFVAIWLCLVLAGGALHAWSATTWSRLLAADPRPIHRQGT
jgi:hypothetical protein